MNRAGQYQPGNQYQQGTQYPQGTQFQQGTQYQPGNQCQPGNQYSQGAQYLSGYQGDKISFYLNKKTVCFLNTGAFLEGTLVEYDDKYLTFANFILHSQFGSKNDVKVHSDGDPRDVLLVPRTSLTAIGFDGPCYK